MRYLVCLIGGALLGALFAVMLTNILGQRHAYPKALMTVMQHELGRMRDLVRGERCMAPDAASAGAHLALLAPDIESAILPPGARDRVFTQYANDLGKEVEAFNASADCSARKGAITRISNACDACHRDYK
ncbi:MAG TPA: hypothetical protein VHE32_13505 [Rhodanobacteraceae bacterium]|jgi:cytochrome c556|nr:hypothetical protein [Rhodanobacteraceae bacterium]